MANNLQKLKDDWFSENAPFGKQLGYPDCCMKEFCDQPPALLNNSKPTKEDQRRFKAAHLNGKFTGFIPCKEHAKQIITGKITLMSLIKNRSSEFGIFPNHNNYLNK